MMLSSSTKKKSKKDKKRRLSSDSSNTGTIKKEEPQDTRVPSSAKKVKFKSESAASTEPAKCLTFPSKHTQQLSIQVQDPDSTQDPIVVSFPSGLPSSIAASNSNSASNDNDNNDDTDHTAPPVFTWTTTRKSTSKGRILMGTDSTCTYTAMNNGRGYDSRLTKLYIAIHHKPTNTLKFIPSSEKGTVFSLEQQVSDYTDSKSFDHRNMTMSERRRMVFESFGSQKKKKVMRSQDANVVEMKSVVGAGEGMMKALGSQMEMGAVSESNRKVMEDLKSNKDSKVCLLCMCVHCVYVCILYIVCVCILLHC
jgi:hypothetical protein